MSEDGIIFTYIYETLIIQRQPASVPARLPDDWAQHAIDVIDSKLIPGWNAVLETEETFLEKMAIPAAAFYPGYLDPFVITRKGRPGWMATVRHRVRLAASYDRLKSSIDLMLGDFRDAFEQRLRDTRPAYKEGEALPLSLTGDYFEGVLGAAVRQWFFLGSTAKFATYRWASDLLVGTMPPEVAFVPHMPAQELSFRLVRLLIQGGCMVLLGQSLSKVHEDLDNLMYGALADEYDVPPQSTIRFVPGPVPKIRTVLQRLEVRRLTHHPPPVCPDFDVTITADTVLPGPGNEHLRVYYAVIIADIQHVATFTDGAEYAAFNEADLGGEITFQMDISEASIDYASHGTSTTTNPFTIGGVLVFITQTGLGYATGEGTHPVQPRMRVVNHDDATQVMLGRGLNYNDQGDGTAALGFNPQVNFTVGTCSNWDIYRLIDGSEAFVGGIIEVGAEFDGLCRYFIDDNLGQRGSGLVHLHITGV